MISYDANGMLVLPEDVQKEYKEGWKLKVRNRHHKAITGVFVSCVCGHTWERRSKNAGNIMCHKCNRRMDVEEIKEE